MLFEAPANIHDIHWYMECSYTPCHLAPHMMAILLIYSYNIHNMDVKGGKLIQYFVALLLVESLSKNKPA